VSSIGSILLRVQNTALTYIIPFYCINLTNHPTNPTNEKNRPTAQKRITRRSLVGIGSSSLHSSQSHVSKASFVLKNLKKRMIVATTVAKMIKLMA
jgi:hypothetical protein